MYRVAGRGRERDRRGRSLGEHHRPVRWSGRWPASRRTASRRKRRIESFEKQIAPRAW